MTSRTIQYETPEGVESYTITSPPIQANDCCMILTPINPLDEDKSALEDLVRKIKTREIKRADDFPLLLLDIRLKCEGKTENPLGYYSIFGSDEITAWKLLCAEAVLQKFDLEAKYRLSTYRYRDLFVIDEFDDKDCKTRANEVSGKEQSSGDNDNCPDIEIGEKRKLVTDIKERNESRLQHTIRHIRDMEQLTKKQIFDDTLIYSLPVFCEILKKYYGFNSEDKYYTNICMRQIKDEWLTEKVKGLESHTRLSEAWAKLTQEEISASFCFGVDWSQAYDNK